jgi:hypothetical protein
MTNDDVFSARKAELDSALARSDASGVFLGARFFAELARRGLLAGGFGSWSGPDAPQGHRYGGRPVVEAEMLGDFEFVLG